MCVQREPRAHTRTGPPFFVDRDPPTARPGWRVLRFVYLSSGRRTHAITPRYAPVVYQLTTKRACIMHFFFTNTACLHWRANVYVTSTTGLDDNRNRRYCVKSSFPSEGRPIRVEHVVHVRNPYPAVAHKWVDTIVGTIVIVSKRLIDF